MHHQLTDHLIRPVLIRDMILPVRIGRFYHEVEDAHTGMIHSYLGDHIAVTFDNADYLGFLCSPTKSVGSYGLPIVRNLGLANNKGLIGLNQPVSSEP